jgi:chromosome segregation ATPase
LCDGAEAHLEVEAAKAKLNSKEQELQDSSARFERLQGSKEKVEAELLQSVRQRREAQLSWNEQRTELEGRLQVHLCPRTMCALATMPHKCGIGSGSTLLAPIQDSTDQIKACNEGQWHLEQKIQTLSKELDTRTELLVAKRAKKRKWKAEYLEKESKTVTMRQELRDKQFAVEKAVQRFTALEARLEAGTQIQLEQKSELKGLKSVADLEAMLQKWQEERNSFDQQFRAAQEVSFPIYACKKDGTRISHRQFIPCPNSKMLFAG